jgi:outer membrane PBP1 activator LpoA protein
MTSLDVVARARLAACVMLASVACAAAGQQAATDKAAESAMPSIALVLPSQATIFAQASEAVRQGFFAAHQLNARNVTVQVIEVDDDIEQLYAALAAARDRGVRVAVGPLPRAAVNALVDGGRAVLPLVTLNHPDRDAAAPATMISFGLSVEGEAQRAVKVALAEFVGVRQGAVAGSRFVVLTGSSALARRVGQAYVGALRAAGEPPTVIEVTTASLDRLALQLETGRFEAAFLALDVREAALARARIPRSVLIFGTSQLNIGNPATSPGSAALALDLDGVRFVDMPWLLQPDHPAVMVYPQPAQPLAPDLARLYALGIDAYRLAQAWMNGESRFELDGVTGHLRVDRSRGPRVERIPSSAIYRNGTIEREEVAR